MNTCYQACYGAHQLSNRAATSGVERLSLSLFNACVDLNPHQIEAALFALRSPLSKGVILADEVGLGKTIEGGLLLCQYWAERKRRLIVICPAALRQQWRAELLEKFNLSSQILEAHSYRQALNEGNSNPFETSEILICSLHFAASHKEDMRAVNWDLVVIDEAHKLRNAYRPSNKMGQNLRLALEGQRKVLLTATPLQNSLLELYGLATLIDEHHFGDLPSFRAQFMSRESDLAALRERLAPICKRTLRKQVLEYIRYTDRRAFTQPFHPSDEEHLLYEAVSDFLLRDDTYSIPQQQRHLTMLILRKLLASSSHAVAGTLETMKVRLESLRDGVEAKHGLFTQIVENDDIGDEYLDDILDGTIQPQTDEEFSAIVEKPINRVKLKAEIAELGDYIRWARGIGVDAKARALLQALKIGFDAMNANSAQRKALIFTESRRTQDYVQNFLEAHGYAGKIVLFNGSNTDAGSRAIYQRWQEKHSGDGSATGSKPVDIRRALVEEFAENSEIMIATEAAAEGINLQFCSLVINYDLPWNPQRIEQRIGRCHRYGQKHDVVVINFLNERNQADQRVLELLTEKFRLFDGVFGASDEVIGSIEAGIDFESRVLAIYQSCRTPAQIEDAFRKLQTEMEATIAARLDQTRQTLLEHFDEDVHARLKIQLDDARTQLDLVGKKFWDLTRFVLKHEANFCDQTHTFELNAPRVLSSSTRNSLGSAANAPAGLYHLISKTAPNIAGDFLYRLSHPLGEDVVTTAKNYVTPPTHLLFDISHHATRVSVVETLKGKSGWLRLEKFGVESFEHEEYLLFSGFDDDGNALDNETFEKMFALAATEKPLRNEEMEPQKLEKEAARHAAATLSRSLETNNRFFQEERERLDKWAEDMVLAAEKELSDTKTQLKALSRQARLCTTTAEQHEAQEKIAALEKKQRQQRRAIFYVEDEIGAKRDKFIKALEKRLQQRSARETLFSIRWSVV